MCDHIGHRVYTVRIFQNLTEHFCIQCLKCGAIVRQNNKLWLKAEDIPQDKAIHVFDEVLYEKGLQ